VGLARPNKTSLIAENGMLPVYSCGTRSGHVQKDKQNSPTSGHYDYKRNPLYLGSLILGRRFAIGGRSWWICGSNDPDSRTLIAGHRWRRALLRRRS